MILAYTMAYQRPIRAPRQRGDDPVKVTQGHYLHSSDTQRRDALAEAAAELGLGPLALPTSSPSK